MNENEKNESIPIDTEESPSVVLELIHQLKVKDVMTTSVIAGTKDQTMRQIRSLARENELSGVPIVEGQHLIGIVTTDEIISAFEKGLVDNPVEEVMTKNVICLQDEMPLSFAISYLNKYKYTRFPVLNKEHDLVGILSSSDVIRSLLIEMNQEVLKLEKNLKDLNPAITTRHSDMEFIIERYNFEKAGHGSIAIKKALKQWNYDSELIRRIAIASYELEINLVAHAYGGWLKCSILPDRIIITAIDEGPGIPDIEKALTEGFSTANDMVRSNGFGAGMGLANTKRVSDEFTIDSVVGKGTTVRSVVYVSQPKEQK